MKCEYVLCKKEIPNNLTHMKAQIINYKFIEEKDDSVYFCSPHCLTNMFLYMGYGSEKEISESFGIILNDKIGKALKDQFIPKDLQAGK